MSGFFDLTKSIQLYILNGKEMHGGLQHDGWKKIKN